MSTPFNRGYVICVIATLLFLFGVLALDRFYPLDEQEQTEQMKFNGDEGLFFVVSYRNQESMNSKLLCDYVRKDSKKGELVCREWKTGEYYILAYPVSVYDVTLTKDYIKFTNLK